PDQVVAAEQLALDDLADDLGEFPVPAGQEALQGQAQDPHRPAWTKQEADRDDVRRPADHRPDERKQEPRHSPHPRRLFYHPSRRPAPRSQRRQPLQRWTRWGNTPRRVPVTSSLQSPRGSCRSTRWGAIATSALSSRSPVSPAGLVEAAVSRAAASSWVTRRPSPSTKHRPPSAPIITWIRSGRGSWISTKWRSSRTNSRYSRSSSTSSTARSSTASSSSRYSPRRKISSPS